MQDFDLREYLANNPLNEGLFSKNKEEEEDDGDWITLTRSDVNRNTDKFSLKKMIKIAKKAGLEPSIEDGNFLFPKAVRVGDERDSFVVNSNGVVFGDDLWGTDLEKEEDVVKWFERYVKDQIELNDKHAEETHREFERQRQKEKDREEDEEYFDGKFE